MGCTKKVETLNPPITHQSHILLLKQGTLEGAKSIFVVDGVDLSPHPSVGPINVKL